MSGSRRPAELIEIAMIVTVGNYLSWPRIDVNISKAHQPLHDLGIYSQSSRNEWMNE